MSSRVADPSRCQFSAGQGERSNAPDACRYRNALSICAGRVHTGLRLLAKLLVAAKPSWWPAPKAGRGLRFGIFGAGHNDNQVVEAPGFMAIRRWVHVAVTLQGNTGRLYVDGVEAASSQDILLSPRQVGDQVTFLGRNWAHPSFDGRIQDFRVNAGALSAAEIAALVQ